QGEGTLFAGAGSQTFGSSRRGGSSAMSVDPWEDCTFWYTSEYLPVNGIFNWSTRIGSFSFPGCALATGGDFTLAASPGTLNLEQGAQGPTTISTALTTGGTPNILLSVSGLPAGASALFNPASVIAGASSTLTIATGSAATGSYGLTVTG